MQRAINEHYPKRHSFRAKRQSFWHRRLPVEPPRGVKYNSPFKGAFRCKQETIIIGQIFHPPAGAFAGTTKESVRPGSIITQQSEFFYEPPGQSRGQVLQEVGFYCTLAAGLVVSFAISTNRTIQPIFPLYWVGLELTYFVLACRTLRFSLESITFATKAQLKVFIKICTHIGALTIVATIFDFVLDNSIFPKSLPDTATVTDIVATRTLNFLRLALALSAIIAIARVRSLARAGFSVIELVQGDYLQRTVTVPAQKNAVEAELALRLQKLRFTKAPRFNRMFFETIPRIREGPPGHALSVELTWPLCPTKVRITLCAAERGTDVHLECSLRGGLYSFEILPAPKEVMTLLNFLKTNLVDATDSDIRIANALRKQDEFRHLAVEAQLRMLQTQIEPHFLFNTLANVQEMYREDIVAGEAMLNHLTAYFRGAVEGFRCENSTIGKELDLSYRYLAIMQARMGSRLKIMPANLSDLRDHPIPPAMLISLVENAIKHGISPKMEGTIGISAVRAGDVIRLQVEDDGAGFSSIGGTGVGLTNLRQRLDALYGAAAWLEIEAGSSGGFKACIVLPFEREGPNA